MSQVRRSVRGRTGIEFGAGHGGGLRRRWKQLTESALAERYSELMHHVLQVSGSGVDRDVFEMSSQSVIAPLDTELQHMVACASRNLLC